MRVKTISKYLFRDNQFSVLRLVAALDLEKVDASCKAAAMDRMAVFAGIAFAEVLCRDVTSADVEDTHADLCILVKPVGDGGFGRGGVRVNPQSLIVGHLFPVVDGQTFLTESVGAENASSVGCGINPSVVLHTFKIDDGHVDNSRIADV